MNDKKKLVAASAAYILGLSPDVKIKGGSEQITALQEVLVSSRTLYLSLRENRENDIVVGDLEAKTLAAEKFKKVFGYHWPF